MLWEHPDDLHALFLFGSVMLQTGHPTPARLAFERCRELDDGRWQVWNALGRCESELNHEEAALDRFHSVLQLQPGNATAMANIATTYVRMCRPQDAMEWADRCLAVDPEFHDAHIARAFSLIALRDYGPGWDAYRWGMGTQRYRDVRTFGDPPAPEWDGTHGQRVVVYGEQGLGDEILMSNALLDAARHASIAYETHPKLLGLMRRSFPYLDVHGTRMQERVDWPRHIDASISLSQLQCLYRRTPQAWDGTPWLRPDEERVVQWRALLDTLGPGRKVGIAWTGGMTHTQRAARSATLRDWLPVLRTPGVHWVSLEYRDPMREIHGVPVKIHHWARANQTDDLDDQAALVAALDMVIAVPTTVVHLAGALGIPCQCIVHERPHCFFGVEGQMPYYRSVELIRRGPDWSVMRAVAEGLSA